MGQPRKLTHDEIHLAIKKYKVGQTPAAIGKTLGVSGPCISYHVHKAGVRRTLRPGVYPNHKKYPKEIRKQIACEVEAGIHMAEITGKWDITDPTVRKYAREFNKTAPDPLEPYWGADKPDTPPGCPTRVRRGQGKYMREYGITEAERDAMLTSQQGRCAICGKRPHDRRLAIDHCHDTGRVRGLLCTSCNLGLGCFKDEPGLLTKAKEYLSDLPKNRPPRLTCELS